ncbi:MAG: polysaccharide deacetylase family protein [Deltaproteobacteria bacterium]|nr:polysaccharide deacetylase family protein [Deltaproteobacteria bacterium]
MNPFKELAIRSLSQKVLAPRSQRVVLLYHDVSDESSPQYSELYSTTPARYKQQIEWLTRHYRIVSLDEIVSPVFVARGKPLAAVTFDDGFQSVQDTVFPWMFAKGLPFAVFINGLAVAENHLKYSEDYPDLKTTFDERVYLTAPDVRSLANHGIIIGNHCTSHRALPSCSDSDLNLEIVGNRDFLQELIGKSIRHLAIPYGKVRHYNDRVLNVCRSSGHRYIHSSNPMAFNAKDLVNSKFLIPRIGLTNHSVSQLTFLVNRPMFMRIDI